MWILNKGEPYVIHDFCKFPQFCHPSNSFLIFCSFRKFCRSAVTGPDDPALHLVLGLFIWCEVKLICFRNSIKVFGSNYAAYIYAVYNWGLQFCIFFCKHIKIFCLSVFSWPRPSGKFFFFSLNIVFVQRQGHVIWKYIWRKIRHFFTFI